MKQVVVGCQSSSSTRAIAASGLRWTPIPLRLPGIPGQPQPAFRSVVAYLASYSPLSFEGCFDAPQGGKIHQLS